VRLPRGRSFFVVVPIVGGLADWSGGNQFGLKHHVMAGYVERRAVPSIVQRNPSLRNALP
jgi:hypothetical protein